MQWDNGTKSLKNAGKDRVKTKKILNGPKIVETKLKTSWHFSAFFQCLDTRHLLGNISLQIIVNSSKTTSEVHTSCI